MRHGDSLAAGPPMPAQMLYTFPFIRETVENVACPCGKGGVLLGVISLSHLFLFGFCDLQLVSFL